MSWVLGFIFGFVLMILDYLLMRRTVEKKFVRGYTHKKLFSYLLLSLIRWGVLGAILIGGILVFTPLRNNVFSVFAGLTFGVIAVSFLTLKRNKKLVSDSNFL